MTECDVAIVGAGPTGMMLAAELTLVGVDAVALERRPGSELVGSRAGGLHARTLEILDQRGIAERFLAEGKTAQAAMFGTTLLDISDFPTRHPYALGIWQNQIERILAEWAAELGVRVRYGREVTGFIQGDAGVEVELSDGETLRARYLVGCDGGRSVIRKLAGIEFPGWEATRSSLIAEVEMTEEPEAGMRVDHRGAHGLHKMSDDGPVRVVVSEEDLGPAGDVTLAELSAALIAVYDTDFGVHSPTWISRFTDMTRQAASYREGRVLLAGDSAHVHYPAGGQGIQIGIQDAVNLGWKLAQVVNGTSPEGLLDTYQAERHHVTARTLRQTIAAATLQRADERMKALRESLDEVMGMEGPRKHFGALISGLDVRYDLGDGHPLLGRRMPDLDLGTPEGPVRVYELLQPARPVLLNLGEPDAFDIAPWADRVVLVDADYDGAWEIPAIGEVDGPTAVLIRPDGHVAWVGDRDDAGLTEAMTTWFGGRQAVKAQ